MINPATNATPVANAAENAAAINLAINESMSYLNRKKMPAPIKTIPKITLPPLLKNFM